MTQNNVNDDPGNKLSEDPGSSVDEVKPGASNNNNSPKSQDQKTEITLPSEAADTDLIEKEWVEKAKEVVEHTKDDPHEQQKAISLMKQQYQKKRFNYQSDTENV